jgi:hypothetical protein
MGEVRQIARFNSLWYKKLACRYRALMNRLDRRMTKHWLDLVNVTQQIDELRRTCDHPKGKRCPYCGQKSADDAKINRVKEWTDYIHGEMQRRIG